MALVERRAIVENRDRQDRQPAEQLAARRGRQEERPAKGIRALQVDDIELVEEVLELVVEHAVLHRAPFAEHEIAIRQAIKEAVPVRLGPALELRELPLGRAAAHDVAAALEDALAGAIGAETRLPAVELLLDDDALSLDRRKLHLRRGVVAFSAGGTRRGAACADI
jgi:hypothetical protein